MDLDFKGKTAVVTGGSKGIGFAIAREFLNEGANVFICARNQNELEKAVKELSKVGNNTENRAAFIKGLVVDGTKENDMEMLAKEAASLTGKIDAWVNNIGTTTASEYTPYKIRVNAVLPGYTKTPLVQGAFSEAVLLEVTGGHIKVLNARESWEQA